MRALGIDYGRRRIGLALSDPTGMLARPWKTIPRDGNPHQVASALAAEVSDLRAEPDGLAAIVLGFPRRLSGEPSTETPVVEQLAAELRALIDLPIVLQDERLTSLEAESRLAARVKDWRKRKPLLDAAAAAVILQDYLDAVPRPGAANGEDAEE